MFFDDAVWDLELPSFSYNSLCVCFFFTDARFRVLTIDEGWVNYRTFHLRDLAAPLVMLQNPPVVAILFFHVVFFLQSPPLSFGNIAIRVAATDFRHSFLSDRCDGGDCGVGWRCVGKCLVEFFFIKFPIRK